MEKTPFIKELASSNRAAREKALESLRLYLTSGRTFSVSELVKLWRGLFFCMYHTPAPLPAQRLTNTYVALFEALPGHMVGGYLRAFWITMGAEWHGLDRYRLDKYLYLIRRIVGSAWGRYIKVGGGGGGKKGKKQGQQVEIVDEEGLEAYLDMLSQGALAVDNQKVTPAMGQDALEVLPKGPDGLRYHLIDIWVDELEKIVEPQGRSEEEEAEEKADAIEGLPVDLVMRPIRLLQKESITKEVRKRAKEAVEDDRVRRWAGEDVTVQDRFDPEAEDAEWGGFAA